MNRKDISKAAALLGSLNRGKKKNLTDEGRRKCSLRLAEARKKRWPSKNEPR